MTIITVQMPTSTAGYWPSFIRQFKVVVAVQDISCIKAFVWERLVR